MVGVVSVDQYEYNQEEIDRKVDLCIDEYMRYVHGKSIREIIPKGSNIVIKPNLVAENNFLITENMNVEEKKRLNECFTTNKSMIKALLKQFIGIKNLNIKIVEAPVQFCRIEAIITNEFLDECRSIYTEGTIEFVDVRRTIYYKTDGSPIVETDLRSEDNYIDIHVDEKSVFEEMGGDKDRFRVTDYPPKMMKEFHQKGKHVYRVAKEIIEADFIFNLPKLKAHQKAGMTGAMKNFVGIIGNKEGLPHHTKGCPRNGGDCYQKFSLIKMMIEDVNDVANEYISSNPKRYWRIKLIARILGKMLSLMKIDANCGGDWWGNDTLWKTIIDINRCVYYGTPDAKLAAERQRTIFSLVDAVIVGQGEGPMSPNRFECGKILFGEDTAEVDTVGAMLIGFDDSKIKYLYYMNEQKNYSKQMILDGRLVDFEAVKATICQSAKPAKNWEGHIEMDAVL